MSLPLDSGAVVAGVRDLPPLPAVVMELMLAMGHDDLSLEQLATLISRDPALAAKTLRLANSPFYGMPRHVTSVADATTVLGLRMLRSIVTAAGLTGAFSAEACQVLDFPAFWRHSIGTALCAQSLAQTLHMDADAAFTIGLLHDIGRLLLASRFPQPYAAATAHALQHGLPRHQAELEVLGVDHAGIGGLIAEHWRFAPEFVQAIVAHHQPPDDSGAQADARGPARIADLLHVADNMAHALDLSRLEDDQVPPLSMPAWQRLSLTETLCVGLFHQVEARHQAVCDALSM